jgi:hypothetical protein
VTPADGLHLDADTVADIAVDLWRARRRLRDGDPPARHLDSLRDRLARAGVEIQEHEGLAVDAGTALDVVAWEVRAGVDRDVVVETVVPSVYCAGRPIRIGQVIAARSGDEGELGAGDR